MYAQAQRRPLVSCTAQEPAKRLPTGLPTLLVGSIQEASPILTWCLRLSRVQGLGFKVWALEFQGLGTCLKMKIGSFGALPSYADKSKLLTIEPEPCPGPILLLCSTGVATKQSSVSHTIFEGFISECPNHEVLFWCVACLFGKSLGFCAFGGASPDCKLDYLSLI